MAGRKRALIVGLTGNIASGKSTVAKLFAARGAAVVDADQLAREVCARGSVALEAITDRFGAKVLSRDGELDRRELGRIIFADAGARAELEAIMHPAIRTLSTKRFGELAAAGARVIVYEAALLIEAGREGDVDRLVVVTADDTVRLHRVIARDGLAEGAARARLAAQMPQAEKARRADVVIDNSGDLAALTQRVDGVWRELAREFTDAA